MSPKQKRDLAISLQNKLPLYIKPSKLQSGGALGAILASVGIPLLLNAISGKGLQVDSNRSRGSKSFYILKMNGEGIISDLYSTILPYHNKSGSGIFRSLPFYGTWDKINEPVGMGMRRKKKSRVL